MSVTEPVASPVASTVFPALSVRPADSTYKLRRALEAGLVPLVAIVLATLLFCVFLLALGRSPADFFVNIWIGAFGSWFSLQNTLARAAPLLLTALCVAVPAQLGLVIIGGEGALVLGGLAATCAALALGDAPILLIQVAMAIAGAAAGGVWIGFIGYLRARRGINETVASLVMAYIAIAVFNQLVEGPLRDPASLNKPSSYPIPDDAMIGNAAGPRRASRHRGRHRGVRCVLGADRPHLDRVRRAGDRWQRAGGAAAGPAGGVADGRRLRAGRGLGRAGRDDRGGQRFTARANASLIAGYGYAGILIAFLARQNPLAIMPMAVLLGGIGAAGGLLQRRMGLPDATVLVLQGMIFVAILASETIYGRIKWFQPRGLR